MSAALLGCTVRTHGLSRADLNGLTGTVVRLQEDRAVVSFRGHGEKSLHPRNLEVIVQERAPAGGAGFGVSSAMLAVQARWHSLNDQQKMLCFGAILFGLYMIYKMFFAPPSYAHYGYDDYDDGHGYGGGGGGWGIGTLLLLAAMYWGHQNGMSPFQLLMLYNLLGGGGGGYGRRRRGFF